MAIKGGQIIHAGNGQTVIDRIQTGGPGQVNIPTEKIYELGNYKSLATIRDTPDLTFTMESFDVSPEIEAMVTNTTLPLGAGSIDLATAKPIDIASQFKAGKDAASPFSVVTSVALPFLYLESMSYRFGYRDNATQSASFRGDSIFYNPGPTYVEVTQGTNLADQTVVTAQPAYQSSEGDARRVLSVTAGTKRLSLGADYSEAYGAVTGGAAITTLTIKAPVPVTDQIRIVYASPTALAYNQAVHAPVATVPAAVKGQDIDVYLGGYDPGVSQALQSFWLPSVQSVNVDWRVTIDKDNELGNAYSVASDFDVPTVNGSIELKPRDPQDFQALLRRLTGVTDATKVIGTKTSVPLELDIVIRHPETGAPLKRLHVEDARFTAPGYQGRVNQKTNITVNFESDEGSLLVFAD